jgi:tripartite-type tricarboxylate transporter receptor subunit TctC
MGEALKSPNVHKQLAALGARPASVAPEKADEYIENERVRWTGIIRQADIKFD